MKDRTWYVKFVKSYSIHKIHTLKELHVKTVETI